MRVPLPERPMNQFELVQQNQQEARGAYSPNVYTVSEVQYAMENHKFVMPSSTCLALQWLREFVATAQFLI